MIKVIGTEIKPIKLWLSDIEEGALEQAKNLANLPFTYRHVAIMPDSHQGYGMPIGGVVALEGVVIPNAVGVDIGCGMCAVKTDITEFDKEVLKKIMGEIRKTVPVGFAHHKDKQDFYELQKLPMTNDNHICWQEKEEAMYQLGTLGGGNHFIELQKDEQGYLWVMIHSGSRNLGFKVANYYNEVAEKLNEKWVSSVEKKKQLAFLPVDTQEGQDYLAEMNYCVQFAYANRQLMLKRICDAIRKFYPFMGLLQVDGQTVTNIAHNYASIENHFGKNVWVHRKGATKASEKTIGIIPGSQGTASYIVKGLGNKESFESCSHGAGRKMSRTAAQSSLDLEKEKAKLDLQGIIHGIRTTKDLDEASGAYKDIDVVMENQKDLVEVLYKLTPVAVIKG